MDHGGLLIGMIMSGLKDVFYRYFDSPITSDDINLQRKCSIKTVQDGSLWFVLLNQRGSTSKNEFQVIS